MSAPAAKARSLPVRTTAATESELWKSCRAALSSEMRGVQRALRALGRLRVTRGEGLVVFVVEVEDGLFYLDIIYTLANAGTGLRDLDVLIVCGRRSRE
jgi:hypothetical protein